MQENALIQTRDVVLIGGGHTHALALRMWGMKPVAGARLTLINPDPTAAYSGMLPGFVAGHYARDELDIDLVQLARFAGARLILGAADHLDCEQRQIHVPGRPPIGYDLCSIDIGITSAMPDLPGFAQHGIPAKPLSDFAARWQQFRDADGPARIAVIGGGIAGVELVLAMTHALLSRGRETQAHLIDRGEILKGMAGATVSKMRAALKAHGVTVIEKAEVARVEADHLVLSDERHVASAFTAGAAGARPYEWLSRTGLDCSDGFLEVNPALQTSSPDVFAVGDCAHMSRNPRPKAGVYAVRQAPVLVHNLRASLQGKPLSMYRPQKDYLKLVSMGEQRALAERGGFALSGRMMWRWKDYIDQKFMNQFRDLSPMAPPPLPKDRVADMAEALGPKPLCGGCGSKLGRGVLRGVLDTLPPPSRGDIRALPGDDAALLVVGGQQQVLSSDHLSSLTNDPYAMARIAAIHALGDIWAMGAEPQAATVSVILPRLSEPLTTRTLSEIMTGASETIGAAKADIVGGHSSVGTALTIGYSITGLCENPVTLGGGRPGDVLILTKPIGSGTVMAAEMQMKAKGAWVAECLRQMQIPQGEASGVLRNAHAMTDVTGFGLAGHLLNICQASGCAAELLTGHVPLLPGALDLARAGIRSTLYTQNAAMHPGLESGPLTDLMLDPQTAGGLLAAVPEGQVAAVLQELRAAGFPAVRIGQLVPGTPVVRFISG